MNTNPWDAYKEFKITVIKMLGELKENTDGWLNKSRKQTMHEQNEIIDKKLETIKTAK